MSFIFFYLTSLSHLWFIFDYKLQIVLIIFICILTKSKTQTNKIYPKLNVHTDRHVKFQHVLQPVKKYQVLISWRPIDREMEVRWQSLLIFFFVFWELLAGLTENPVITGGLLVTRHHCMSVRNELFYPIQD